MSSSPCQTTNTRCTQVSPTRKQPRFRWLQIVGTAGRDHMGLAADGSLVVSQTVLDAVLATNPTMLAYEEFKP